MLRVNKKGLSLWGNKNGNMMKPPSKDEYRRLTAYLTNLINYRQTERGEFFTAETTDVSTMRTYHKNHRVEYWLSPRQILALEKEIARTKMYLARWDYQKLLTAHSSPPMAENTYVSRASMR